MNFFFDRCMSIRLAHMAAALEDNAHIIRHHDDDPRFCQKTSDVEWIDILAKDGLPWIVVSADGQILKKAAERHALSEANLTFFVMADGWASFPIYDWAWKFMKVWPDIIANAKAKVPSIFKISAGHGLKVEFVCHTRQSSK
jgi:PIN like domain